MAYREVSVRVVWRALPNTAAESAGWLFDWVDDLVATLELPHWLNGGAGRPGAAVPAPAERDAFAASVQERLEGDPHPDWGTTASYTLDHDDGWAIVSANLGTQTPSHGGRAGRENHAELEIHPGKDRFNDHLLDRAPELLERMVGWFPTEWATVYEDVFTLEHGQPPEVAGHLVYLAWEPPPLPAHTDVQAHGHGWMLRTEATRWPDPPDKRTIAAVRERNELLVRAGLA